MKEDTKVLADHEIDAVSGGSSWYAWAMSKLFGQRECYYDGNCTYTDALVVKG